MLNNYFSPLSEINTNRKEILSIIINNLNLTRDIEQLDVEIKYSHLTEKTNFIMNIANEKNYPNYRLNWINDRNHFVVTKEVKKVLDFFEKIAFRNQPLNDDERNVLGLLGHSADNNHDADGGTIAGLSGTGKTAIIREIIRRYYGFTYEKYEIAPMVWTTVADQRKGYKAVLGSLYRPFIPKMMYTSLMESFLSPTTRYNYPIRELSDNIVYFLKIVHVILFFLDEFQQIANQQGKINTSLLNEYKNIMQLSNTPIVIAGLPIIKNYLQDDQQLWDRCRPDRIQELKYWDWYNTTDRKNFRDFLYNYAKILPFPEESSLGSKDLSRLIFEKIQFPEPMEYANKTNVRNLTRFLRELSIDCFEKEKDYISENDIKNFEYAPKKGNEDYSCDYCDFKGKNREEIRKHESLKHVAKNK